MSDYQDILKVTLKKLSDDRFLERILNDELLEKISSSNDLIEWIILNLDAQSKDVDLINMYTNNLKEKDPNHNYEKEIDLILKVLENNNIVNINPKLKILISAIPVEIWRNYTKEMKKILSHSNVSGRTFGTYGALLKEEDWFLEMVIDVKKLDLSYHDVKINPNNTERICKIIEIHINNLMELSKDCLVSNIVVNYSLDKIERFYKDIENKNWKVENKMKNIQRIAESIEEYGSEKMQNNYRNILVDLGAGYTDLTDDEVKKVLSSRVKTMTGLNISAYNILNNLVNNMDSGLFGNIDLFYHLISSFNEIVNNANTNKIILGKGDFEQIIEYSNFHKNYPGLIDFFKENNLDKLKSLLEKKSQSMDREIASYYLIDYTKKLEKHLLNNLMDLEIPKNNHKVKPFKF